MSLLLKDAAAALDYSVDWGADYLVEESLVDSMWSVTPVETGGVTIDSSRFGPTIATVVVSSGVAGRIYRLSNQVTTSTGRHDVRSVVLRVGER